MDILSFDDLLQAARAQPEPQRLLFVFTGVELPEDSTPVQRARFEAGQGGALVQESRQFGHNWGLVFAAAMSGSVNRAPTTEDAEEPLQRMVESIKQGQIGAFIPFDPQGQPVQFG